jgi:hypothetical protein
MAKKRKSSWMTPERRARYAETERMLEERIAYHKAMAERAEREPERRHGSVLARLVPWRLRLVRVR